MKFYKKVMVLMLVASFGIFQAHAQPASLTYGSGWFSNGGTPTAGTSGSFSTFIGCGSGNGSQANYVTAFGFNALGSGSNTGQINSAFGYAALGSNTSGSYNTGIGTLALYANTTGANNSAVGAYSLKNNSTGQYNTANGYYSLYTNTTGSYNSAHGGKALYTNSTGSNNTADGYGALYSNTNGSYNTAIGYYSGNSATGSNNVFLGYQAGYNETGSNTLYISNSSTATPLIYGDFSTNTVRINSNLNINNVYTLPSSNGTNGQVLQTSGSGTLIWYTPTTGTVTGSGSGARIAFWDGVSTTSLTSSTDLHWDNINGRLGIGVSSPSSPLEVRNFVKFSESNTFLGCFAGLNNTGGLNTAIGASALHENTSGEYNTAIGWMAAYNNTTGSDNISIGFGANGFNTTGSGNISIGDYSNQNTASTGKNNNTVIGYYADVNGNYSGSTAIGKSATVANNDYMVFGTSAIQRNGGYQNWYNGSDGRFKFNIQEDVKGIEFIKKLRPVTYQMNAKMLDDFLNQNFPDSIKTKRQSGIDFNPATAMVHSGFIAQEVEQAALDCGFKSTIVSPPANSTDIYNVAYAEIVVPLVKAVQELTKTIDSIKVHQKTTDSLLMVLQNTTPQGTLNRTIQGNNDEQLSLSSTHDIELSNNAILYQNSPNPFSEGTTIKYFVPENANVQIVFMDEFGNHIKEYKIEEKGMGQLNVTASNLASGMYSYSLIVNGRVVDTKKMIKQ